MELTKPAFEPTEAHEAYRSRVVKISRQSAVVLLGTLVTLGAGYFFKIYTAHVLGAEGLGLYALGMSIVSLLSLLAAVGIPRTLVRFIPAYLARQQMDALGGLVWRGGIITTVLSLIFAVITFLLRDAIAVQVFHKPELGWVLGLLVLIIPIGNLGFFLDQTLTGFQQPAISKSLGSFFTYPLTVGLTILFFSLGYGLGGYINAGILSGAVGIVASVYFVWRLLPRAARVLRGLPPFPREAVSYSTYMFAMSIVDYASGGLDNLLLGVFMPVAQIGVYSVAATAAGFIPLFLGTANSIFAPMISETYALHQFDLLARLLATLTRWITALTLPLFFVLTLFSTEFLSAFGKEFDAGSLVLIVLVLGQMINVISGPTGYMLLMSGHHRPVVWVKVAQAIVTPLLYLLLIPPFGIVGAGLVGMIGLIASNGAWLALVWKHLKMTPYNRSFLTLILPSMISVIALYVLHEQLVAQSALSIWIVLFIALVAAYL
ncbi:MAG TPA: oligosaccharide flippase family protein, partial [Anaerolineae bacterium]|nr:oligosaccharide flippase family protein [Anaerolineae bacterium]